MFSVDAPNSLTSDSSAGARARLRAGGGGTPRRLARAPHMVRAGAQIFFASMRAVLEIFCVGAVGVLGARRGWLDRKTCKTLSTFNGNFFLPALLWVSLSRSVSASALRKLWLLPVTCVAHVTLGLALGLGVVRWAPVKPGFRTVALMSSGFGNSLALPVVVARAIIKNPRIGNLTFTSDDNDRAVLYLSSYVVVLSGLMWTLGPFLFRRRVAAKVSLEGGDGGEMSEQAERDRTLMRQRSFANRTLDFTRTFFNPAIASCVLGVATGMAPPVRDIIFNPGRALSWIGGSAEMLADAAIPSILLVIGASLAYGPDYSLADRKTSLAIVGVRFAIIPFFTIGLYYAFRNVSGIAPDDKTFWLVFLMLGTTPTANNMMLQAQMFHDDDRAGAGVGTLLFWQYLACPVFLTAFVSWYLAMIDR